MDAEVSAGGQTFRENILFTHWGLSGPAILQASLYWTQSGGHHQLDAGERCNRVASCTERSEPKATLGSVLKRELPTRFVDAFIEVVLGWQRNLG